MFSNVQQENNIDNMAKFYSLDAITVSQGFHVCKETTWSNANVRDEVRCSEGIPNVQKQPPGVFYKKFTRRHLCRSLYFNKVTGLRLATLCRKRLRYRCFLVSFVKVLWTSISKNNCKRLLLMFQRQFWMYFCRYCISSISLVLHLLHYLAFAKEGVFRTLPNIYNAVFTV